MRLFVLLAVLLLPLQAAGECGREPFELVWAEKWRDGGSISVTVTDSLGCVVAYKLDWRIGSATHGRMYVRGLPEERPGQRLAGAAEQRRILDLLERVADANLPPALQAELLERGCRDSRLDHPFCGYCIWLLELLHKTGRR